jgi:hypothetical protein
MPPKSFLAVSLIVAMTARPVAADEWAPPESDDSAEALFGGGDDEEPSSEEERSDIDAALGGPEDTPPPQGLVVHVVNERPDPNRGLLQLAHYRGETAQAGFNAIVVTTHYDVLCTEPCGEPIDVSTRPILFFVRDGSAVTRAFRLSETGEITLSVKPERTALLTAGLYTAIFLVGIPMMVLGWSKVSMAKGPPSANQTFKKVKRAKF